MGSPPASGSCRRRKGFQTLFQIAKHAAGSRGSQREMATMLHCLFSEEQGQCPRPRSRPVLASGIPTVAISEDWPHIVAPVSIDRREAESLRVEPFGRL